MMKKSKNVFKKLTSVLLILFLISVCTVLSSCSIVDFVDETIDEFVVLIDSMISGEYFEQPEDDTAPVDNKVSGSIQVHFLDVGQGDCALVVSEDGVILIDSSYKNSNVTKSIIDYIKKLGISKIDYFVLTHPHADHIGGAPSIINEFEIEKLFMPNCVTDTKIFEDTLDAIENNDVDLIEAVSGEEHCLGEIEFKILAPNYSVSYNNLNDYSIVIRLVYGNTSVMFTGDAEKLSESEILSLYPASQLKSDILKVGHHGSSTSSSIEFLRAVSPSVAIISVGEGNSYEHPHDVTLETLYGLDIPYYRTDNDGTIVFYSDGNVFTQK